MEVTRAGAIAYYRAIAKTILPHLRGRPLAFRRWTDTVGGEVFWEKDAPSFTPDWVKRVPVPRREGGPPIEYIVCNNSRTLTWLASVGGVELHPFLHKAPRIDVATHVVFDLDPGEGADIRDCVKVARLLREALPLESFAKVSGGKGIQVYVPLDGGVTHEVTETFARLVAEEMARRHPTLIVAKMAKALRRNKVFIDWSQNADYKTTVAVYSLRESGFVSMPVRWEELSSKKLQWTPDEAIARVRKVGDLFAPVLTMKQKLLDIAPSRARRPQRLEPAAPRFPKPSSQSGRRLFVVVQTDTGSQLWLDMRGRFKRFRIRADRTVIPTGDIDIDPAYYRGEVPKQWQSRVRIEDRGAYEIIEGSWQRKRFDLWFSGAILSGRWVLEFSDEAWRLAPTPH